MKTNRQQYYSGLRQRQSGMATLIMILVVLLGLTAVTFYAANSGLTKQRIAANENRAKEAFEAAEIGTNMAANYVQRNTANLSSWGWSACSDATFPCGDGTNVRFDNNYVYYNNGGVTTLPISDPIPAVATDPPYQVSLVAKCDDTDDDGSCDAVAPSLDDDAVFVAVAQGWSLDKTGTSTVQQAFRVTKAFGEAPDAPLIASGSVPILGSFEIVSNHNGGGQGVPLSAWTGDVVSIGGSATTCYVGEFLDAGRSGNNVYEDAVTGIELCDGNDCSCQSASDTGKLSSASLGVNEDIVHSVNPFPDLFAYVFGMPRDSWREMKESANIIADCTPANLPNSTITFDASGKAVFSGVATGLYWVEGDCTIGANRTIGSPSEPVLLVVEDAELQLNGGATVFGLLYVFDKNDDGADAECSNSGVNQVYGALVCEGIVNLTAGTFRVRYDETVLSNVSAAGSGRGLGRLPGTWLDYF